MVIRCARWAGITGVVMLTVSGAAIWPASAVSAPSAGRAEPGAATAAPGWRVYQTHHYADYSSYNAVAASGRNDAWVFGGADTGEGPGRPIARHWTGGAWRDVPLPAELKLPAYSANANSPSNAWALAGVADGGPTYALRWNGRKWSVSKQWNDGLASDVVTFGPRNVWVLGYSRAGDGIGTWHFNGSTWKQVDTGKLLLHRLSATSAKDIWAVGAEYLTGCGDRTIARFNGKAWTQVQVGSALPPDIPEPDTGGPSQCVYLRDVTALSTKNVWVTGEVARSDEEGNHTYEALLLHWNGRTWQRVDMPSGRTPLRMVPDGRGGLWIIDENASDPEGSSTPLLHRTAGGAWTTTRIDAQGRTAQVSDLTLIPGTRSLWAAGRVQTPDTYDATVYRLD